MKAVVVVGGGVFGQTAAAALREAGHQVVVYDCRKPDAGTPPSAGIMKPSWIPLSTKELDASFEMLNRFWGVKELTVETPYVQKLQKVFRLNMPAVWAAPVEDAEVTSVKPGEVTLADQTLITGVAVVVAAGVWCRDLLSLPDMLGKKGVAFQADLGDKLSGHRLAPWAPYKQVLAIREDNGSYWLGDGTALKPENWKDEQNDICLQRIAKTLKVKKGPFAYKAMTGIRPLMKNGYQQLAPDLFLCTGAGKNGSAMAGSYAQKIVEALS